LLPVIGRDMQDGEVEHIQYDDTATRAFYPQRNKNDIVYGEHVFKKTFGYLLNTGYFGTSCK